MSRPLFYLPSPDVPPRKYLRVYYLTRESYTVNTYVPLPVPTTTCCGSKFPSDRNPPYWFVSWQFFFFCNPIKSKYEIPFSRQVCRYQNWNFVDLYIWVRRPHPVMCDSGTSVWEDVHRGRVCRWSTRRDLCREMWGKITDILQYYRLSSNIMLNLLFPWSRILYHFGHLESFLVLVRFCLWMPNDPIFTEKKTL